MTKITVTMVIHVDLNGASAPDLADNLSEELINLKNCGVITQGTDAEVEDFSLSVDWED